LKIDTVVQDIEDFLLKGSDELSDELLDKYASLFRDLLKTRLAARGAPRKTLRMSNVGRPCERQTWYEIKGHEGEPLRPETYMKFLYGDLSELLLLFLVEVSGHSVEGTQDTQEIEGIKGHRDAVIDGVVVDVKSASTYSFKKFTDGTLAENDSFGYVDQLQSYLYAGQDDPVVTDKERAAFLVLDKTLGHICLDIHERQDIPYDKIYRHKKKIMESEEPPKRGFQPVPEGKSGNEKLPMNCSYCSFKHHCHPGLRTFIYSNGPTYLTRVQKEPKVNETSN